MKPRAVRDEAIVVDNHPATGERALLVLPVVPEDAPFRVRVGIARRRITAISGACPCGATVDFTSVAVAEVMHENLCPASTEVLLKALRRWLAG